MKRIISFLKENATINIITVMMLVMCVTVSLLAGCAKKKVDEITSESESTDVAVIDLTSDDDKSDKEDSSSDDTEQSDTSIGSMTKDNTEDKDKSTTEKGDDATTEKPGKTTESTTERPGKTTESTTERPRTTESTTERPRTTESTTERPRTTESTTERPKTTEQTEVYEVWVEKILVSPEEYVDVYVDGLHCNGCSFETTDENAMFTHQDQNFEHNGWYTCKIYKETIHYKAVYLYIHHMSDGTSWQEYVEVGSDFEGIIPYAVMKNYVHPDYKAATLIISKIGVVNPLETDDVTDSYVLCRERMNTGFENPDNKYMFAKRAIDRFFNDYGTVDEVLYSV